MRKLILIPVLFCFAIGFGQEFDASKFCKSFESFDKQYKKEKIKPKFGNTDNAMIRMILGNDVVDINFKLFGDLPMFQTMISRMGQKREYREEFMAMLYAVPSSENPVEVKTAMDTKFSSLSVVISACDCTKSEENSISDESYEAVEIAFWDCGKKGKIELKSIQNKTTGIHAMVLLFDRK